MERHNNNKNTTTPNVTLLVKKFPQILIRRCTTTPQETGSYIPLRFTKQLNKKVFSSSFNANNIRLKITFQKR
jgi:hypothetical protein